MPNERNGQSCGNCFYRGSAYSRESSISYNICVYNPPTVVYIGQPPMNGAKADSLSPVVPLNHWCGQWRKEFNKIVV